MDDNMVTKSYDRRPWYSTFRIVITVSHSMADMVTTDYVTANLVIAPSYSRLGDRNDFSRRSYSKSGDDGDHDGRYPSPNAISDNTPHLALSYTADRPTEDLAIVMKEDHLTADFMITVAVDHCPANLAIGDHTTASFMIKIMAAIHFKPGLESATIRAHLMADQTTEMTTRG